MPSEGVWLGSWVCATGGGGVVVGAVVIPGADPAGTVLVGLEAAGLVRVPPVLVAALEFEAPVEPVLDPDVPVPAVLGPYVLAAPSTDAGAPVAALAEPDAEPAFEPDVPVTMPLLPPGVRSAEPPDAAVAAAAVFPVAVAVAVVAPGLGAPASLNPALARRAVRASVGPVAAVEFVFGTSVATARSAGAIAAVLLDASLIAASRTVAPAGGWGRA